MLPLRLLRLPSAFDSRANISRAAPARHTNQAPQSVRQKSLRLWMAQCGTVPARCACRCAARICLGCSGPVSPAAVIVSLAVSTSSPTYDLAKEDCATGVSAVWAAGWSSQECGARRPAGMAYQDDCTSLGGGANDLLHEAAHCGARELGPLVLLKAGQLLL
eukprot:scaffold8628_cov111-Isochrysis_galbana.AAC.9